MRRWLLAGVLIVFPIAGTVALAGPALAGGGVSCTKLTGKVNSNNAAKITLSGCNDTSNTGGGGTTSGSSTSTTATIKWNNGKTTTEDNVTTTVVSTGATCPSGDIEEETTGDVTGGTSTSIKKGWTVQSFVCYNPSTSKLSLAPGTTFQIGKSF